MAVLVLRKRKGIFAIVSFLPCSAGPARLFAERGREVRLSAEEAGRSESCRAFEPLI